eukprot:gene15466-18353_t
MKGYIYEVTATINSEIADKWAEWIVKHVKLIVGLEDGALFKKGTINKVERLLDPNADDSTIQYVMQYHIESLEALDRYIKEHAPKLRQEPIDLFGNNLKTSRRDRPSYNNYNNSNGGGRGGYNGGSGFRNSNQYSNNRNSAPQAGGFSFKRPQQSFGGQQDGGDGGFDGYVENRGGGRSMMGGNDGFSMPQENIDWTLENLPPITKNVLPVNAQLTPMTPEESAAFLSSNNITVKSKANEPIPSPIVDLSSAPFPASIVNSLKLNFEKPTPIQSVGWPIALTGGDMIGVSQTGSGKTISFFLPAIQHLISQPKTDRYMGPQVLIIAPTRELSNQINQEAQPYLRAAGLRATVMFGGDSKSQQIRDLKRMPHVIIGTPGRILDIMRDGFLSLKRISFFVLDEADRMLEMGFEDQIRSIFKNIRPDRQVLYWTATWPRKVSALANEFIVAPVHVQVGSSELSANPNIAQNFIFVDSERDKVNALIDTMEVIFTARPTAKVIIFTMTKEGADKLASHISSIGNARIESIHGDKPQARRTAIINGFKSNAIDILVATDVASRGLDIRTITDVINFSMPLQAESYVHRIGRTARAGAEGFSHSLISRTNKGDIDILPEIIELLERSGQAVPEQMVELAPKRSYGGGGGYRGGNFRGGRGGGRGGFNSNRGGGFGRGGSSGGYSAPQARSGPVSFAKRTPTA